MAGQGPLLVVLTGPSGAGKDSILARLRSLGRPYHFAVTATTRAARPSEREGVDYFFVSPLEFQRMLERGELLENALVYGHRYGVPKAPIRDAIDSGQDILFRTDVQGARYIKAIVPSAVTIFVAPPSVDDLKRRLQERGSDTSEQLELRLRIAEEEMEAASQFDYTVVNEDLERCVQEIEEALRRERARPGRQRVSLE